MYFKNKSEGCTVVLMTERGKITVKPGEVVDIKHKIYAPVSNHIVKTTEEEYLTFQETRKGFMEALIEQETTIGADIIRDDSKVGTESTETTVVEEQTEAVITESTTESTMEEQTEPKEDANTEPADVLAAARGEDPNFMENLKALLSKGIGGQAKTEEITTKTEETTLLVTETTNNEEVEKLEAQLEDLKKSWVETTKVKTKDKISKQIKEVQKQIDKIRKHEELVNKQN